MRHTVYDLFSLGGAIFLWAVHVLFLGPRCGWHVQDTHQTSSLVGLAWCLQTIRLVLGARDETNGIVSESFDFHRLNPCFAGNSVSVKPQIGFSLTNNPFWGTPMAMETPPFMKTPNQKVFSPSFSHLFPMIFSQVSSSRIAFVKDVEPAVQAVDDI